MIRGVCTYLIIFTAWGSPKRRECRKLCVSGRVGYGFFHSSRMKYAPFAAMYKKANLEIHPGKNRDMAKQPITSIEIRTSCGRVRIL